VLFASTSSSSVAYLVSGSPFCSKFCLSYCDFRQSLISSVISRVDYCNVIHAGSPMTDKRHLMNAAVHLVTGTHKFDHGLSRVLHDLCTALAFLKVSNTRLASQCTAVCRVRRPILSGGLDCCTPVSDIAS